ncbi:MAG: DUF362 domain-containing protein [Desulfobulbaceae bacterium]
MNRAQAGIVHTVPFASWEESPGPLLTASGLADHLPGPGGTILIKPNLVEALPPPITTPVGLVAALIAWLREHTAARIVIGEGSGAMEYETSHAFTVLGYTEMASRYGVELTDLNHEELVCLRNANCHRWPEMHLPRIALDSFLISVPVLKAHSMAGVTLTLKNMMGLAPPAHYRNGRSWKKSAFHSRIQEAIADLNRYRTPDFTLLDATVGMAEAHLWGPVCDPPVTTLAAAFDPVAIDAYGATLLNREWRKIGHIRALHDELGLAEPLRISPVSR